MNLSPVAQVDYSPTDIKKSGYQPLASVAIIPATAPIGGSSAEVQQLPGAVPNASVYAPPTVQVQSPPSFDNTWIYLVIGVLVVFFFVLKK
jgi:hypothetical protein